MFWRENWFLVHESFRQSISWVNLQGFTQRIANLGQETFAA
jgi:hypothetical protein